MIEPAAWNHPARGRRTSVEILTEGASGCSAHAQVACHLARACGIPVILVKTLDVDWIEKGNQGDGRGAGHVFVEVLIGDAVALWDAQRGRVHVAACDAHSDRFHDKLIYDKGGPERLMLSHHGPIWEAETKVAVSDGEAVTIISLCVPEPPDRNRRRRGRGDPPREP